MKKIAVLGAGLVGKAIAIDLCDNYQVTSVDLDPDALTSLGEGYPIKTIQADLMVPGRTVEIINDMDLVICSVPGFMGFQIMKIIIESGKDSVDISFFPENPFDLDELAKKHQVTAVVDCGVAPGMPNMMLGYHNETMEIDQYKCYVGGLPQTRSWPFEYKAPFSPTDVIEEYTRPARCIENGHVVIKEALSEPELLEFEKIGTLEAFNTDGLRSLLETMSIPNMTEKTLRYPGHIELMKIFRETGFFSTDPITAGGVSVKPRDVVSKLLFEKWKLGENEEEFTVMNVYLEGKENGKPKQLNYYLHDCYDEKTKTSSMARTVAYACTAVANLIMDGKFNRKGICPPEFVGAAPGCFQKVLDYQTERGVHYHYTEPTSK